MASYIISVNGSKNVFRLNLVGNNIPIIEWSAEDTFYSICNTNGAGVTFIKKSSNQSLGNGACYNVTDFTIGESDPLFGTLGGTIDTYAEFQAWAEDNLGFNTASGGSEVEPGSIGTTELANASVTKDKLAIDATTARTFTGTVIPCNGYYTQDNTTTDTATWTLGATVVNGAAFDILINQATEPTITGATQIPGTAEFQTNTLSVIKGTVIQGVVYYYFLALA